MRKALYGMMLSSLLFYKYFRHDLESIGFKINPYDMCVTNQIVKGYVNNVKVSHIYN